MSKISNVVNIKSGYANFVELKSAYEETQENADRMAMYRPTKAHRAAFERICRGLYQPNDKKFYLLSGSYGTGKSHLCLMLANVLSRSSNDPEIGGFYENYSKLDPEKAKLLKNVRKNGQYLVAICDYHSGQHFEDVVMKAVFDACKKKDLNVEIETEFDEAERQLAKWKEKGEKSDIRNFYQDFIKALELSAPGVTVDQLRAGLKNYNSDMLEKFRIAFREMMGGVEFQSQAGNLIPIIQNLIKSQSFKERFKGLAIFFDEFGFTLEKSSYSKQILQGFMETICKNEPNVLFIGCIHKDFKSYADRFSQDDAAVMQARITQVDLLNEGIEEIIGAIVETEKNSDIWKKEIEPKTGIFDQLLPPCKSLDLFPWIDNVNRIRERVLEDIYGVHPMALSCLLNLSSEIGSDARSTFTFFAGDVGEEEGSYADYIKKSHITLPGGKLNLYTVNQLFTFFKKELSQSNPELRERQRQFINGYFASLDALRKTTEEELLGFQEDERVQLLRTILIYQLCQIPTNLENIQFGHFCLNNAEKSKVKEYLQDLVKNGAVFFRQQSKTYELAASSGEDPYDLIERFMADTSLHPSNKLDAFLNESAGQNLPDFIEAKGYNLPFGEDKRFRARYKQAKDLGNALWDDIQREYSENKQKPSKSFEGTLVYVLCEDDSEINVAIEAAKTIPDENIAIAVPREPQPYTDTLLKVKACRYFLPPNEAEKISAQTESRLRDIFENPEDGYLPKLKHIFTNINEGSDACWYTKEGKVLVDKPKQSHKPADML
jgi:predicted AAA+ superfamily ATPase